MLPATKRGSQQFCHLPKAHIEHDCKKSNDAVEILARGSTGDHIYFVLVHVASDHHMGHARVAEFLPQVGTVAGRHRIICLDVEFAQMSAILVQIFVAIRATQHTDAHESAKIERTRHSVRQIRVLVKTTRQQ